MQPNFRFGEDTLLPSKALALARHTLNGVITEQAKQKIKFSAEAVASIAIGEDAVYGINTGFGPLCTTRISPAETSVLQEKLLKSHAVGIGDPVPVIISQLMLVLKVHALAQGHSGLRLSTIERILWHIDNDVIPLVPEQGSVGASGDLAPLSHLFLPLLGLGQVWYKGKVLPTAEVLQQFNLTPIELGPKEGLGLINGTQFMAAYAVLLVAEGKKLLDTADLTGAMMVEALLGSERPFDPKVHQLRPHTGAAHVAARVRQLLANSEIVASHVNCDRVQDPYSLRCIPQVHGASRRAWLHLKDVATTELNAVTDNPLIFSDKETISAGNFHGQLIALPLDYMALAMAELGNISDRRMYFSLEGKANGVPKLLLEDTGLNSGFMITQYTAAALVSENKSLCFPASADSIPTSLGQEDHVSMGSISGRKAWRIIQNVEKILGIELFCAAQARGFHTKLHSNPFLQSIYEQVRESVPQLEEDVLMHQPMETAIEIVRSGVLLEGLNLPTAWESHYDNW